MPDKPDQPWMPDRPESNGASERWIVLLVLGFCSLGVIAAGALGFVAYWFLLRGPDFTPVAVESREEKRAALAAAFGAKELGVDEATLAPIRELFDRIQACSTDEEFRKLIDVDRFFRATIESDAMPHQPQFLYDRFRPAARESIYRPWETARYQLRRVEPLPDGEYLAYGYFWDINNDAMEMRWWLVQSGQTWKVYDWELLQIGTRRSRLLALFFRGPSDGYNRFYEELNTAYESMGDYDHQQSRTALQRAEKCLPSIPEQLRAEPGMWAAQYWCSLNEYDEALRVASLLPNPDDVPGVYATRLMHAHDHEQHDKVLEYSDALEAALGPTPTAARYRAEALDKLGRHDEAAAAVSQLLELDPASAASLGRLVLSLPADRINQVASVWKPAERSQHARKLAETLIAYGDLESGRALAQVAESAAERSYILGLCAEAECHDLQAAQLFLDAVRQSTDAEVSAVYRHRYLTTMSQLDRIVEAYHAMPDEHADAAFVTLLSQDEDTLESYLSPVQLKALLAAHAERGSDDPQWHLAAGEVAEQADDTAAAVAAYQRGLEFVDEESDETGVTWQLAAKLRAAQTRLPNGWRMAYEDTDDPVTAFGEIAASLAAAKKWVELSQLVKLHDSLKPDDVMVSYYRGLMELEQGNAVVAEATLKAGQARIETPEDEWDYQREQFRRLRIRALLATDQGASVYDDPTLRPSALPQLVPHYQARNDVNALMELARRTREADPRDPSGWQCAATLMVNARDDAGLAELLKAAPWSDIDFDDYKQRGYEWRNLAQQRFRSLLRLGRFEEAGSALEIWQNDNEYVSNEQIELAARRGDVAQAREWLLERAPQGYGSLFNDDEIADILWSDAFRDVREQYPPQVSTFIGCRQWILLQQQARPLVTADVETLVRSALGESASVTPLLSTRSDDPPAWLITAEGTRFVLCEAAAPYTGSDPPPAADFPDPDVFSALKDHRAWCQVAVLSREDADESQDNRQAARLLRALTDVRTLALYDPGQPRVITAGPALDAFLAQGLQALEEIEIEPHYLAQGTDAVRETMSSEWLRRPLRVFALERHRGVRHDWTVTLPITCGEAVETVTLAVDEVEPNEYASWTYKGRLTSDSKLHPQLRTGERVEFSDWLVSDWTVVTSEGERHGRAEAETRWTEFEQTTPIDADPTLATPTGAAEQ